MPANDFFQKMCKEAIEEIAGGDKGWREAEPNVLILACFGMLFNHLSGRLVRPLWFAAGSIGAAAIVFGVRQILGM